MPDIYVSPSKKSKPKPATKLSVTSKASFTKKKPEKILRLKKKSSSPLSSYLTRPAKFHFETQERKEKIVLLIRRHWATNIPWITTAIFLFMLSGLIPFFPLVETLPWGLILIIRLVWYLLVFAFVFEKFLTWFYNVNIITDERIVDIDFPSILYKDISETKIDQIQDISVKVGGFGRSLFNFGDVLIQTAGSEPEIYFQAVPNPEQVSKVLNELILEEEQEKLAGRAR